MNNGERFLLCVAVLAAATAAADGLARLVGLTGTAETVQAITFFVSFPFALHLYVTVMQSYRRHGWKREANNGR